MNLEGRVALVTGASRGIGKATALRLARAGAAVVVNSSSGDGAEGTAEEIRRQGGRAVSLPADVTRWEAVEAMCAAGHAAFGKLEILVNCAGIIRRGTLETASLRDWHDVLAVNLTGTFYCCRAAVPYLKAGRWGRIVNISSIAAKMGDITSAPGYASAKAGVLALTKSLARDLAPWGITVNALAPHAVETEMTAEWSPERRSVIIQSIPLGRLATVEEVAEAVLFLVSPAAAFITGETLDINGGMWMD